MARLRGFPSVLAALTVGTLEVTGAATFASTVTATGQFLATAGTDGAPGYAFAAGTTVGMRLGAADSLRFVGGGAVFAVMDANGITTTLNGTFTGYVQASSFLTSGGYGRFGAPSDGVVVLSGASTTDFGRLCFGGTTSAYPALKRTGGGLSVVLADDSGPAAIECLNIVALNGVFASAGGNYSGFSSGGNGVFVFTDGSGSGFTRLCLGGASGAVTATKPAFGTSGTTVTVVLGDGSGYAPLHADSLQFQAGLVDGSGNTVVGARGAAVADATGGATVDAEARTAINTMLARLRAHGLIAT